MDKATGKKHKKRFTIVDFFKKTVTWSLITNIHIKNKKRIDDKSKYFQNESCIGLIAKNGKLHAARNIKTDLWFSAGFHNQYVFGASSSANGKHLQLILLNTIEVIFGTFWIIFPRYLLI